MEKFLAQAPTGIVDYLFLMDALKGYKKPRSKITSLLKKGELIRVKKGLYVIVDQTFIEGGGIVRRYYYSKEVLANLIYGPSYLSLEYALSYYGLIPERVEEITSVTSSRNKKFETPVGRFSYSYLHPDKYPIGVTYERMGDKGGFLIATVEKALADCVARHPHLKTGADIADYINGLRIEQSFLAKMHLKKIREIAKIYQNHQVDLLKNFLEEIHEQRQRSHSTTDQTI